MTTQMLVIFLLPWAANMTQQVTGSTHPKGHTLDLTYKRWRKLSPWCNYTAWSFLRSQSCSLQARFAHSRLPIELISATYRSTKSLTADVLDDVIPKLPYVRDPNSLVTVNLTTLVSKYNIALEWIYSDLAPMKSRWITHRPHAPWYNDDLH